jgi:predicted DsbA family dithiol-disulfide isomerase
VPYFVLNHAYGIPGAQPAEVLVAAIEKVRMQESGASTGKR